MPSNHLFGTDQDLYDYLASEELKSEIERTQCYLHELHRAQEEGRPLASVDLDDSKLEFDVMAFADLEGVAGIGPVRITAVLPDNQLSVEVDPFHDTDNPGYEADITVGEGRLQNCRLNASRAIIPKPGKIYRYHGLFSDLFGKDATTRS